LCTWLVIITALIFLQTGHGKLTPLRVKILNP
jgi:hypothetical protein